MIFNQEELLKTFNNYVFKRKIEEAYKLINDNIEEIDSMKLLNNLGLLYMNVGVYGEDLLLNKRYDKAINCFKKAIDIETSPIIHYPYTNLGEALIKLHRYEEAQEVLLKSIEIKHSIVNQNNLACCLFYNGIYEKAEYQLEKLITEIKEMNIFDVINKENYSLNNASLFVVLYNLACIKSKLHKLEDIKKILYILMKYYLSNLIDIEDVDLMDILCIAYICKDYKMVIDYFPESGYIIDEICFGIYVSSMLHLNINPTDFYDNTIQDYYEELIELENIKAKQETETRIERIKHLYDGLLNKNNLSFEMFPRIIQSNYMFFE